MNLQSLFQDFNPSKFVVHCCLLSFTVLFCLRLDDYIDWPYWVVFVPLWIWKSIATLGAAVGAIVWVRYPLYRVEGDSYSHFKAMLISLSLHLILLMFELLACDRLTSGRHLWVLVFIPLIFGSAASVGACVWAVKHDRSFELELFCAVNALQFVFLPLKLDGLVSWSWEVVFVPLWIVLCLSLVAVLYSIIFCVILLRTPEVSAQQKKSSFYSAIGNCATVIPVLIFQVLLADKLDEDLDWPYIAVAGPLLVALSTLILLSFNAKGGNKWWFGIRKTLASSCSACCPVCRNTATYHITPRAGKPFPSTVHMCSWMSLRSTIRGAKRRLTKKNDHLKPVVPIVSIELPD
uniref:Putative plasma membrane protein n=1 Tax=Anopheles aquasalis TaxID=42839 RepID=T1E842_ANOAQ